MTAPTLSAIVGVRPFVLGLAFIGTAVAIDQQRRALLPSLTPCDWRRALPSAATCSVDASSTSPCDRRT